RLGTDAARPDQGREGVRRRPDRHPDRYLPRHRRDGLPIDADDEGREVPEVGDEHRRAAQGRDRRAARTRSEVTGSGETVMRIAMSRGACGLLLAGLIGCSSSQNPGGAPSVAVAADVEKKPDPASVEEPTKGSTAPLAAGKVYSFPDDAGGKLLGK